VRRRYLGTIKALEGQDISRKVAEKLVAVLAEWLGQQDEEAQNPRLAHAISEGKTALTALRERLN
jgi:DNA transposition AAA+ family ATPase